MEKFKEIEKEYEAIKLLYNKYSFGEHNPDVKYSDDFILGIKHFCKRGIINILPHLKLDSYTKDDTKNDIIYYFRGPEYFNISDKYHLTAILINFDNVFLYYDGYNNIKLDEFFSDLHIELYTYLFEIFQNLIHD